VKSSKTGSFFARSAGIDLIIINQNQKMMLPYAAEDVDSSAAAYYSSAAPTLTRYFLISSWNLDSDFKAGH
jgi:hypothetical protein